MADGSLLEEGRIGDFSGLRLYEHPVVIQLCMSSFFG